MSASPGLTEPVPGSIARFELTDGRRVDVHVPKAVGGVVESGPVIGFRIFIRRPDGSTAAELQATDLLDVFSAHAAADALAAFDTGDLEQAHDLARQAGPAWRGLVRLLQEVAVST